MVAKTIEAEVDAAIASWNAGDAAWAVSTLEALAARYPDEQMVSGLLGAYLADSGRPGDALPYLEEAVRLEPIRELWARALFHVYLELDLIDSARTELRRF